MRKQKRSRLRKYAEYQVVIDADVSHAKSSMPEFAGELNQCFTRLVNEDWGNIDEIDRQWNASDFGCCVGRYDTSIGNLIFLADYVDKSVTVRKDTA